MMGLKAPLSSGLYVTTLNLMNAEGFSNHLQIDTPPSPLSSRPGFPATLHWTKPRVRLSVRERRMKCTNATKFHRKSGGAKPRDLRCAPRTSQILEFSRRLFSPGFFEASAKARDPKSNSLRNAEALLPSAKAERSHRDRPEEERLRALRQGNATRVLRYFRGVRQNPIHVLSSCNHHAGDSGRRQRQHVAEPERGPRALLHP